MQFVQILLDTRYGVCVSTVILRNSSSRSGSSIAALCPSSQFGSSPSSSRHYYEVLYVSVLTLFSPMQPTNPVQSSQIQVSHAEAIPVQRARRKRRQAIGLPLILLLPVHAQRWPPAHHTTSFYCLAIQSQSRQAVKTGALALHPPCKTVRPQTANATFPSFAQLPKWLLVKVGSKESCSDAGVPQPFTKIHGSI
jgi:hypothetical protein